MGRATRADVARLAGVSLATVSHVMNGHAERLGFAPATAERVRAAAAEVGYVPRASARTLRYQRSRVVAVVVPDRSHALRLPVVNEILIGAMDRARSLGYFVLPVPVDQDPGQALVHALGDVDLAGAVCRPEDLDDATRRILLKAEVPVAWVRTGEPAVPAPGAVSLGVDEQVGVRAVLAATDLEGTRRPVHLTGPGPLWSRGRAFLERLAGARVVRADGWLIEDGLAAMTALLEEGAPDLLFGANDQLAAGAVLAARQHGVRVPQDLQVIGFGDATQSVSQALGLSTVTWPVAELGALAVQAVIDGGRQGLCRTLGTSPRVRMTTRPRGRSPRG